MNILKIFWLNVLALLVISIAPCARADINLVNQEINTIGAHDGNVMFFTVKSNEVADAGCNFSVVYCPETKQYCKSLLSLAIVAKSTSAKVDLALVKDAGNGCTLQMMVLK